MAYYLTLSTIFVLMSFYVLPWNIAAPAFYMFLCSSLRLYFLSTLQYWYTLPNRHYGQLDCIKAAIPYEDCTDLSFIDLKYACSPDGPTFTTSYYQFIGNFIGAIAATVAVIIFEKVIVHWNVRAAFWVTTVFQMFSTMLEVSALMRWNHALFGTVPSDMRNSWVDQITFLIGTQAIDKIVEMLDFMPCNVLIGNLCPPNIEATIFAVLAGSQNFGTNLAYIFGSIVVEALGVNFQLKVDQSYLCTNPVLPAFGIDGMPALRGLSWARFLGGVALPALTVPLTFILLPNKPLNGDFLDEEQEAALAAQVEGGQEANINQDDVIMGSMPRNLSGVNTSSFVSMASISKGAPGGRGDFTL